MRPKVIIVGAGQIGSRHLQGLALSRHDLDIEIVDPSASARERALERFRQAAGDTSGKSVRAVENVESSAFGGRADVAIVATDARARLDAIRALLGNIRVQGIILEKILFQRMSDLDEARALFSRVGCHVWVNCPRRVSPWLNRLKEIFSGDTITVAVRGGNWGLACNGIHFLDAAAYISESSTPVAWNIDDLDTAILEAKRSGFSEFSGTFSFVLDGGHKIAIQDDLGKAPVMIEISSRRARTLVIEAASLVLLFREETGWRLEHEEIRVPYQSELTGTLVDQLISTGNSSLTPYEESARLHRAYLQAFLTHLQSVTGRRHEVCPIT